MTQHRIQPKYASRIRQYVDWDKISARLGNFAEIRKYFPIDRLRAAQDASPFYCHPVAWRLGTWEDGSNFFGRFNSLLGIASTLPNWENESTLFGSADFSEFWSLLWQLQVAEFLVRTGANVQWMLKGPDLAVTFPGGKWFVECYCYRKSFGEVFFLQELLPLVHPMLRVKYDPCLPLSVPRDAARESFFESILEAPLDQETIQAAEQKAAISHPVKLKEEAGVTVYLDGSGSSRYEPGVLSNDVGSPALYMKRALQEVAQAKKGSNNLSAHRPNLVAASLLLSEDFQLAKAYCDIGDAFQGIDCPEEIDALSISTIGIDRMLEQNDLTFVHGKREIDAALGM